MHVGPFQLRLEKDLKKIGVQMDDLTKVPLSSELHACMKDHCSDMKVALQALEQWAASEQSCEEKKRYLGELSEELKPAQGAMKEAARRIKAAGVNTKPDSEVESVASTRWDLAKKPLTLNARYYREAVPNSALLQVRWRDVISMPTS